MIKCKGNAKPRGGGIPSDMPTHDSAMTRPPASYDHSDSQLTIFLPGSLLEPAESWSNQIPQSRTIKIVLRPYDTIADLKSRLASSVRLVCTASEIQLGYETHAVWGQLPLEPDDIPVVEFNVRSGCELVAKMKMYPSLGAVKGPQAALRPSRSSNGRAAPPVASLPPIKPSKADYYSNNGPSAPPLQAQHKSRDPSALAIGGLESAVNYHGYPNKENKRPNDAAGRWLASQSEIELCPVMFKDSTGRDCAMSVMYSKSSQYSKGAASACTVMALEAVNAVLHKLPGGQGPGQGYRPFGCSPEMITKVLKKGSSYQHNEHLSVDQVLDMRPDMVAYGLQYASGQHGKIDDLDARDPYPELNQYCRQYAGQSSFAAVLICQSQSLGIFFPKGSNEVFLFDSHARTLPSVGQVGAAFYFFDSLACACDYLKMLFHMESPRGHQQMITDDEQTQLAVMSIAELSFLCLGSPAPATMAELDMPAHPAPQPMQQRRVSRVSSHGSDIGGELPRLVSPMAGVMFDCEECSTVHRLATCPILECRRLQSVLDRAEAKKEELTNKLLAFTADSPLVRAGSGKLAMENHLMDVQQNLQRERVRSAALADQLRASEIEKYNSMLELQKARVEIKHLRDDLDGNIPHRRSSSGSPVSYVREQNITKASQEEADLQFAMNLSRQEKEDQRLAVLEQQRAKQEAERLHAEEQDRLLAVERRRMWQEEEDRRVAIEQRRQREAQQEQMRRDTEIAMLLEAEQQQLRRDRELAVQLADKECVICTCEMSFSDTFALEPCDHSCCRDCTKRHMEVQIKDRRIPVTCWQADCDGVIPEYQVHSLIDQETLNLYMQLSRTPTADPSFRQCPVPDCVGYDLVDYQDQSLCTCVQCQHRWCCHCQVNVMTSQHANISCEVYQQWKKDNDTGDEAMEALLREGLGDMNGNDRMRRCPHCRYPWMKDQACCHVTCDVKGGGCGVHFCFRCADFHAPTAMAVYNHQGTCKGYIPPAQAAQ